MSKSFTYVPGNRLGLWEFRDEQGRTVLDPLDGKPLATNCEMNAVRIAAHLLPAGNYPVRG